MHTAEGQEYALPLLSVEVDPSAYGMSGPEQIRRGRLSVVYRDDGLRLVPYYLRTDPVQPRIEYPDPPTTPEPVEMAHPSTRETALWVWQTARILRDPVEREAFLDFIGQQGITRVFLYLAAAEGERPASGYIPFSSDEFGPFLAELREAGAVAYALDGDKDYVRPENHDGVYRTVQALVEHNRSRPAEERFFGVRYDIEPYLVEGFQGPHRQEYLDGYVELLSGVSELARDGGLAVAVDVPFWFDSPDEETGIYMEAVLDGRRAKIMEHVMSLVDDIAIMDYRTQALGANGAVVHSLGELELARTRSVDVFIGVETVLLPDEDLLTFYGPVSDGLPPHADARWVVLEHGSDDRSRLWVVDSAAALEELRERTAGSSLLRHWPAGRPTRVAADLQSFHNLGAESMRSVTGDIIRHLSSKPAFVGLAFHDYMGLRRLVHGGE